MQALAAVLAPPSLPLQPHCHWPPLPFTLVAVPVAHRLADGAVTLASELPQTPGMGAALAVKLAVVVCTAVVSAPRLEPSSLVPVVWPLRRVNVAVRLPVIGAVSCTVIVSPLLTMACCTQAPPFTWNCGSPSPLMRAPPHAWPGVMLGERVKTPKVTAAPGVAAFCAAGEVKAMKGCPPRTRWMLRFVPRG